MTTHHTFRFETVSSVQALRAIYVETARDEVFRSHLDRLLQCGEDGSLRPDPVRFTANGDTRGIVLIDGAGGGKTTLVDRALRRHPALQASPEGGAARFLSVRVPSPATLKSLGLEVLRQSGYPEISERRQCWSIWDLVRKRMSQLGVVVLWIDEAHDLFRTNSPREIEDMLKMLKSLMQGNGAVIVILTGVEALDRIAGSEEQVQRRYSKIRLPQVAEMADAEDMWNVMEAFCRKVGIDAPERSDLVSRLMHGSRYRFGRCIENIINAIENALQNGDPALDIQHFAESWAMQEGCEPARNVFLVSG